MADKLCGTCRHWLQRTAPSELMPRIGTCKRYPPTMLAGGQALPGMSERDWCGEWKTAAAS